MTDNTLHTKYRPRAFRDVIGQDHFIKQLAGIVADRTARAYMFYGPSGCGKTTLARICATELECKPADILEHDGATKNGVGDLRELQEAVRYKPLGGGKHRAVILDEAHRITGAAFDTLLKIVEEPPAHLFWFFCTTNPSKVPKTIQTRCQKFAVREMTPDALTGLLTKVAKLEGIPVPPDVLAYIATKSYGSARNALVNLERCADAKTMKEAAKGLEQVADEEQVIALCRLLCQFDKSRPWPKVMELLGKIEETNGESIRILIAHYIGACLKGARSDADAVQYLKMLDAFSTPLPQSEQKPALLLAIGRALLTE